MSSVVQVPQLRGSKNQIQETVRCGLVKRDSVIRGSFPLRGSACHHLELCELGEWGLPLSLKVPNDTCLFQLPLLELSFLSLLFQGAEGLELLGGEGGDCKFLSPLSPSLELDLPLNASSLTWAALGGGAQPFLPSTASLSLSDSRLCRFCRLSDLLPPVMILRSRPSFKQQLTRAPMVACKEEECQLRSEQSVTCFKSEDDSRQSLNEDKMWITFV